MGWFTSDALLAPVPLHKVSLFVGHTRLSINSFRCAVTLKKSRILHFGLGHQKCVNIYWHICHCWDRVPLTMGWSKAGQQKGAFSCLYVTLGNNVIHPSIFHRWSISNLPTGETGYTRGKSSAHNRTTYKDTQTGLKVPIHLSPSAGLCTVGESEVWVPKGTWKLLVLKPQCEPRHQDLVSEPLFIKIRDIFLDWVHQILMQQSISRFKTGFKTTGRPLWKIMSSVFNILDQFYLRCCTPYANFAWDFSFCQLQLACY